MSHPNVSGWLAVGVVIPAPRLYGCPRPRTGRPRGPRRGRAGHAEHPAGSLSCGHGRPRPSASAVAEPPPSRRRPPRDAAPPSPARGVPWGPAWGDRLSSPTPGWTPGVLVRPAIPRRRARTTPRWPLRRRGFLGRLGGGAVGTLGG